MNAVALKAQTNAAAVESALVRNDISKLSTEERISYYNNLCESVGLNPLTKPFAFLSLQGREVVYATKDCTEQLRKIHGVSTQIVSQGIVGDFYEVQVKAQDRTGRQDEDFASIPLGNLKGADMSNLKMKCITKAKRRVTLSICGLGMLDESELDTISKEVIKAVENPQITNPLKREDTPEGLTSEDLPENTINAAEVLDSSLGDYEVKIGKKHKGKKLSDFDIKELDSYLSWVNGQAKEKNQELTGDWKEFAENAEAFLQSREFVR